VVVWMIVIMAGCTVWLTTPLVRRLGQRLNWVDQPDIRKQHGQPKVRVGGIGLCLGVLVTFIGVLGIYHPPLVSQQTVLVIALGSVLSFGIGLVDDIIGLSPGTRLAYQAGVTLLVWCLGLQITTLPIPGLGTVTLGYLSLPITFLWLVGVTNAINWIDGLDGLAAGTMAIASTTLAMVCYQLHHPVSAALTLGLAATLLGFLVHNARPAQLFMGDGGAYLIGFYGPVLPLPV
jgi:UDP-GlcNAc:undecaprenyl-phosphate GlcNAc-1-phosphate transferase